MKGKHHIVIESARLKYEFEIKRNITIIRGDSATGKTTLIELLEDYRGGGEDSAVRISSDVPCRVFADSSDTWRQALEVIADSIIFIDEDNRFIRTKEFAEVVRFSSNYYVLITREDLPELPYSIKEIYGIRTSGKYHFPEQIYHEFYQIYEDNTAGDFHFGLKKRIITEDAKSGYQFFRSFCPDSDACISANGNGRVYYMLKSVPDQEFLTVIADGAAFGPYMENVLKYADIRGNTLLYLPESFEWIILQSGTASSNQPLNELEHPEDYIDSREYMSWEQYFTMLLIQLTKDDPLRQYQKSNLKPYYVQGTVRDRILKILPEDLQKTLKVLGQVPFSEQNQ